MWDFNENIFDIKYIWHTWKKKVIRINWQGEKEIGIEKYKNKHWNSIQFHEIQLRRLIFFRFFFSFYFCFHFAPFIIRQCDYVNKNEEFLQSNIRYLIRFNLCWYVRNEIRSNSLFFLLLFLRHRSILQTEVVSMKFILKFDVFSLCVYVRACLYNINILPEYLRFQGQTMKFVGRILISSI